MEVVVVVLLLLLTLLLVLVLLVLVMLLTLLLLPLLPPPTTTTSTLLVPDAADGAEASDRTAMDCVITLARSAAAADANFVGDDVAIAVADPVLTGDALADLGSLIKESNFERTLSAFPESDD